MKRIVLAILTLFLLTLPVLAAEGVDQPSEPEAVTVTEDVQPEQEPEPVVVVEEADTAFQTELLSVLGLIAGILVFFVVVILFWAVFKFFRLFF